MELNNGEVIAAILTAGVLNRVSFDGKLTLKRDDAAGEAVELYEKVLNKLKEQHGEIFLPDHSKPRPKSNDTLGKFESDLPRP